MNAFSLIFIVCCVVQDPGAAPLPLKTQTQAVPPILIELIESDSRKVAFIEHKGPYWSLGPAIDTVARDAKAMGIRHGLVIRYLDDPVAASPAALRAEIGFEPAGAEMPKPPYKFAEWPSSLVARKNVRGSDGLSTRHFTLLKAWAKTQGLAPAGDMIALVHLAEGGESTAIEGADILLPVCVPEQPAPDVPPILLKRDEGETDSLENQDSAQLPLRVTRVIPFSAPGEPVALADDSPRLALQNPVQQTPDQQASVRALAPVVVLAAPVQSIIPVRQWIEEGKFAELAAVVLPENVDSASRLWCDQMAARIVALSNGVQKQSSGEAGWLGEFASRLAVRRDTNRADTRHGPQRVIGPSIPAGPKNADRKALMLELDRLMGHLAYQTLKPDQVCENLIQLLEKVPPLVSP